MLTNKKSKRFNLNNEQIKCLNLLADTELYEKAMKFSSENEFSISKSQLNKLNGLVQTLSGTRSCAAESRIGIIVKYLRHQAEKSTTKEDEKMFYNNLVNQMNITNRDGLIQFLHGQEFVDSLVVPDDSRSNKNIKKKKQTTYMYYIAKEFLNHVIAEKLKGSKHGR